MARVQPATFNEEWSDERVISYLNREPVLGDTKDFSILYNAYKHMRPHDFERLLVKFKEAGYDVNGKNKKNESISDVVKKNPEFSESFLNVIEKFK